MATLQPWPPPFGSSLKQGIIVMITVGDSAWNSLWLGNFPVDTVDKGHASRLAPLITNLGTLRQKCWLCYAINSPPEGLRRCHFYGDFVGAQSLLWSVAPDWVRSHDLLKGSLEGTLPTINISILSHLLQRKSTEKQRPSLVTVPTQFPTLSKVQASLSLSKFSSTLSNHFILALPLGLPSLN